MEFNNPVKQLHIVLDKSLHFARSHLLQWRIDRIQMQVRGFISIHSTFKWTHKSQLVQNSPFFLVFQPILILPASPMLSNHVFVRFLSFYVSPWSIPSLLSSFTLVNMPVTLFYPNLIISQIKIDWVNFSNQIYGNSKFGVCEASNLIR